MRSLKARFKHRAEKYPFDSSFICFGNAVRGRGFTKEVIRKWFYKLVDKEDYEKSDSVKLIEHMHRLSKTAEETQNRR